MNLKESIVRSQEKGVAPVIAEIKRVIPKLSADEGRGKDLRDAGFLARAYAEGGASGISLVTEKRYFGGQPEEDLAAVLQATALPVLVKDFIMDRAKVDFYASLVEQVDPAFLHRVTLLLISHMVGDGLPGLASYVERRGMSALVETRGPEDLPLLGSLSWHSNLIGINNKGIDDLETGPDEIKVTPEMISKYRRAVGGATIVSESAHKTPRDVRRSLQAGADAVLVGTAFLTAGDPSGAVSLFVREGVPPL